MLIHENRFTILFLHHTGHFAGAENSLLHLVTNLDKEKFCPVFLCPKRGEFPIRLLDRDIPVIHHEFGRNREAFKLLKTIHKICKVIRSYKVALIHSNGPQTNIPGGLAAKWMGIPVIWHARNLLKNRMTDLDRIASFIPDRILCNSEAIRARFSGKDKKKITKTIFNGVDLVDFDLSVQLNKVRKEFNIPITAKVLGMSSRLGKDKGHLTLMKAVANLKDQFPDIWILIVGGNVFKDDNKVPNYLETKANELGISERTVFTGFRRDVYKLYAGMDIFILGTDAEPCGRVIFEAMAMNKPVIGTNNGGTPEIVVDGETGLLFKYGDFEELSLKIKYLLSKKELMKKMGNAGRKRIEEKFTINKNVEKTQFEYLSLLEEKT